MDVYIKYLPGSPHLEKVDCGDWIDLYTYEDLSLKAGERVYASLGIAMKLPEGYEAILSPRSSTFKRWGLLQPNSIGVIDNSYCGNDDIWAWSCLATRDVFVPKGTRLCQFRIQKTQPQFDFIEVQSLSSQSRGGFGSTGE